MLDSLYFRDCVATLDTAGVAVLKTDIADERPARLSLFRVQPHMFTKRRNQMRAAIRDDKLNSKLKCPTTTSRQRRDFLCTRCRHSYARVSHGGE